MPGRFEKEGKVAGQEGWLVGTAPVPGEIIKRQVNVKLGTIWGVGAKLEVDMAEANSATRDAEKESRKNQEKGQALHHSRAVVIC